MFGLPVMARDFYLELVFMGGGRGAYQPLLDHFNDELHDGWHTQDRPWVTTLQPGHSQQGMTANEHVGLPENTDCLKKCWIRPFL